MFLRKIVAILRTFLNFFRILYNVYTFAEKDKYC